ncbi:MAG: ribosomal RNA small subunit methyltransferase A [Bdellovibrionales bacterium]|jgi:16S rRNA (adenine1518-N6/adenine1519-N6)-dimethyltransferase|nr:ribosomal RNA small subunit methyltransferase A [Bdellovibrionales bacterium]
MSNSLPRANKNLGQHFLNDQSIISSICNDYVKEADCIIEVGPGPAILTRKLSTLNLPYHVIEKDIRFKQNLTQYLDETQITFADILTIELSELIANLGWEGKKIWFVSNLPYNIGVPILIKFMQNTNIHFMSLMFQKEVGLKIIPETSSKKGMGSLHALCTNFFNCKLLLNVPPSSFSPPPKVDSVVISMDKKENNIIPLAKFKHFEKFLRNIFQFKRKQCFKILKMSYSESDILSSLKELNILPTSRAETFNLKTIQQLFTLLEKE